MGQASDFLRLIYGGDGQFPGRVAMWRGDSKACDWVTPETLGQADVLAERCRRERGADLYYGVCSMDETVCHGRGKAENAVGCPGVWVDLDFASSVTKKKSRRKYPSQKDAEQLLERLPAKPSLVIDTGGGWHVYWLFHEVMLLDTPEKQAHAARLVAGWQRLVAVELDRMDGFEVDPTQDLTRVLRPAGSWSWRWGREVSAVESYGLAAWRHYPDDIDTFIPEDLLAGTASTPIRFDGSGVEPFVVDMAAEPSAEMLQAIIQNDFDFAALWNHERELVSNSEQEMAIANVLAEAGWSDQQIVNAIIMHRRVNEPAKLHKATRPDYLRATVGNAKRWAAQRRSIVVTPEEIQLREAATDPCAPDELKAEARATILKTLSDTFGVRVLGFAQFGRRRQSARYYLTVADPTSETGEREIDIGPVGSIVSGPKAFSEALYAEIGHVMPPIKRKEWENVKLRLLDVVQLTEVRDDDELAAAADLLRDVLANAKRLDDQPSSANARKAAMRSGEPFIEGNWAWITSHWLLRYARVRGVDPWGRPALLRALQRMGWSTRTLCWRDEKGRTSRSYYHLRTDRLREIGALLDEDVSSEIDAS